MGNEAWSKIQLHGNLELKNLMELYTLILRTNLEYFLESIVYILYIVSKFRKSKVQRFKRFVNQSWNEEVMVIWRQLHKAGGSFRKLAKLRKMNFASLAKSSCVIFRYFCTESVRFLSRDILCNYLFSPCNKLKIFSRYLGYLKGG